MGIWDTIKDVGGALLPLAGPIGGIASTLIDASSQKSTNAQNAKNIQQQEQFQDTESSTAYQRATADMSKAGLNPALAYQQGGASTPSGGAAQFQAPFQNTSGKLATALDTYNTLATGVAQRDLIREQANAQNAQAHLTTAQANIAQPEANLNLTPEGDKAFKTARLATLGQKTQEAANYPTQFNANINAINAQTATAQSTAAFNRSATILNEQQMQNEWWRKNISPYINSSAQALKTFNQLPKF